MIAAIHIEDLYKKFPRVEALKGVSLSVPEGEFFGLLGPNGAGKTTLIKALVGLARPTAGTIQVFGEPVHREALSVKALVGYSPQEPNIDRYFSVRKTLEFQGGYCGLSRGERQARARELMGQFGLLHKAEAEGWSLSGGMVKRAMVARSLMGRPRILILDEPSAGIDVEQRHELWSYLRGLNRDGTTILLTTHYIDEAEELCDRVAIIHEGRIIELGAPGELIERHCESYLEIRGERVGRLTPEILKKFSNGEGLSPHEIQVKRGTLEEVFLKLVGKTIRETEEEGEGGDDQVSDAG